MLTGIKVLIAIVVGSIVASGLFLVLYQLVATPSDLGEAIHASRIEFSRMRRDTEVATKRDQKIERERPPPTPEVPRLALAAAGLQANVVKLSPRLDVKSAVSGLKLAAGSDRDVIPLVRVPPDYPPRAVSRGIEGWVQVQFTIAANGSVKDAKVVAAEPKEIFDDAALKAIVRWRYNPRIEGGVAVERVGVQAIIRFKLEK